MEQGSGALKILDPDLNLDLISCRSTGQSAQNQSSGSKDGNCSTGYVSTGGALRRAAASGGGVVCANFVMPSVPPKVGSDAARIPVSGSLVGLFEADPGSSAPFPAIRLPIRLAGALPAAARVRRPMKQIGVRQI